MPKADLEAAAVAGTGFRVADASGATSFIAPAVTEALWAVAKKNASACQGQVKTASALRLHRLR